MGVRRVLQTPSADWGWTPLCQSTRTATYSYVLYEKQGAHDVGFV